MEIAVKTIFVPKEKTVYIAHDGTEFEWESDCKDYERSYYRKRLEESGIDTCEHNEGWPNFDGGECCENHQYYWYRPKNMEEIELLQKAFCFNTINAGSFNDGMVGEWICIETDYEDDFFGVSYLGDGIVYAKKILNALGYKLTVSKENT